MYWFVRHASFRRIAHNKLGVILGSYATWFTAQDPALLLTVVNYVASAILEPSLCLGAATSLKELCDANRKALAPHVSAFGELYGRLGTVPVRPLRIKMTGIGW